MEPLRTSRPWKGRTAHRSNSTPGSSASFSAWSRKLRRTTKPHAHVIDLRPWKRQTAHSGAPTRGSSAFFSAWSRRLRRTTKPHAHVIDLRQGGGVPDLVSRTWLPGVGFREATSQKRRTGEPALGSDGPAWDREDSAGLRPPIHPLNQAIETGRRGGRAVGSRRIGCVTQMSPGLGPTDGSTCENEGQIGCRRAAKRARSGVGVREREHAVGGGWACAHFAAVEAANRAQRGPHAWRGRFFQLLEPETAQNDQAARARDRFAVGR